MSTPKELSTTLNKLSIDPSTSNAKSTSSLKDSWEDESDSDSNPQPSTSSHPSAPPPTPISPSYHHENTFGYTPSSSSLDGRTERLRPDKTDAVAKRLIAGALGVKAPKRTEEQRAYDRALKEKEIKKRKEEKEALARAKEEAETAKRTVWED